MADFAGAGAIDITAPPLNLPSATNGDLLRECAHLEIAVTDFPTVAALNLPNTLRGRVTLDVHSGPDRTDVPLELTIDGNVVGTAQDGTFQTTLTPTNPLLRLNSRSRRSAVDTAFQTSDFSDRELLSRDVRQRLQLLGPATVAAGSSINLLLRVAGDGMTDNVTLPSAVRARSARRRSPQRTGRGELRSSRRRATRSTRTRR